MDKFNSVFITKWNDRTYKFICQDETKYKKYVENHPDAVENIGEYGQQIKPVFDVDAYENDIDVNEYKSIISALFPNKPIKEGKRPSREHKGKIKYSYRFYVLGIRITSKNLKQTRTL